ncbi:MAG: hypothetical protein Q9169_007462 [Polycauliona sp. 2 TL-2023]
MAGPAGCALAKGLGQALPQHRILLLDAGGPNQDRAHQTFGERHWTLTVPGYNWGYKTVTQPKLNDREIDYSRGKGLGGSTAINFCVYTRGPAADYDHWAHLTQDSTWDWENARKRFNRLEKFHDPIPQAAASSLSLITIVAATVTKLVLEDKKVVGVDLSGNILRAHKDVLLAAGAIDSAKLLLLSGIGPRQDLESLQIPVVHDLPGVGKNLQDRLFLELVAVQEPDSHHRTSYIDSPSALEQARKEWTNNKTGPLSDYYLPQMIAYLKSESILASKEFRDLDKETPQFLDAETKPHYEIVSQNPSPSVKAPEKCLSTAVAFPGNYGTGSVKLSSSDVKDPPTIHPNFLSHPFDKRVAIESVREALEFLRQPLMSKGTIRMAAGPEGDTDDDIIAYIRKAAISMWHACGTVKMGKPNEPGTCVDTDFKVLGVSNLRVVDMSVVPFLPNAHLQAVAYLIGETAADKISREAQEVEIRHHEDYGIGMAENGRNV